MRFPDVVRLFLFRTFWELDIPFGEILGGDATTYLRCDTNSYCQWLDSQ